MRTSSARSRYSGSITGSDTVPLRARWKHGTSSTPPSPMPCRCSSASRMLRRQRPTRRASGAPKPIGHLLDSANNNLGRIVRLQGTDHLLIEPTRRMRGWKHRDMPRRTGRTGGAVVPHQPPHGKGHGPRRMGRYCARARSAPPAGSDVRTAAAPRFAHAEGSCRTTWNTPKHHLRRSANDGAVSILSEQASWLRDVRGGGRYRRNR